MRHSLTRSPLLPLAARRVPLAAGHQRVAVPAGGVPEGDVAVAYGCETSESCEESPSPVPLPVEAITIPRAPDETDEALEPWLKDAQASQIAEIQAFRREKYDRIGS